jgi:hypothetical protein
LEILILLVRRCLLFLHELGYFLLIQVAIFPTSALRLRSRAFKVQPC